MWKQAVVVVAVVAAMAIAGKGVTGRTFNYPDFCSWPMLVSTGNGVRPVQKQGTLLKLASSNFDNSANQLWFPTPINIVNGFRTQFNFVVSSAVSGGGAGFALVFQDAPQGSLAQGTAGRELGYGGMTNSLAIEFDMYQDHENQDPNNNHVSVHSQGNQANSGLEQPPIGIPNGQCFGGNANEYWYTTQGLKDFQDGNAHSVEIEYNAQTMMLSIIVDERLTPQLTCNVDFKLALGLGTSNSSVIGFTASTGTMSSNIEIANWWLEDTGPGNTPPTTCFPDFSGTSCYAPTATFGSSCHAASTSCDECLAYSRSCCGWCKDSSRCESTTTSGRPGHASETCAAPSLQCILPSPAGNGPGAGTIIAIILAVVAAIGLGIGAALWVRNRRAGNASEAAPLTMAPQPDESRAYMDL